MTMDTDLAIARAGVSYRQFDYWCRRGWLPLGTPGSGNPRSKYLSDEHADLLITMGRLVVGFGMAPEVARRVAGQIVADGSARVNGLTLSRGDAA